MQVKGLSVEKLVVIFGGNDVHHVSTQISFPFTSESDFRENLLVNGSINSECKPFDPSDSLDMVKHKKDSFIYEQISSKFDPFFKRLLTIIDLFPDA